MFGKFFISQIESKSASPKSNPNQYFLQHDTTRNLFRPNPIKATLASGLAFLVGSVLSLVSSAFIERYKVRNLVLVVVTSVELVVFGGMGAKFGGSLRLGLLAVRVLIGRWLAMALAYSLLKLLVKEKDDS